MRGSRGLWTVRPFQSEASEVRVVISDTGETGLGGSRRNMAQCLATVGTSAGEARERCGVKTPSRSKDGIAGTVRETRHSWLLCCCSCAHKDLLVWASTDDNLKKDLEMEAYSTGKSSHMRGIGASCCAGIGARGGRLAVGSNILAKVGDDKLAKLDLGAGGSDKRGEVGDNRLDKLDLGAGGSDKRGVKDRLGRTCHMCSVSAGISLRRRAGLLLSSLSRE